MLVSFYDQYVYSVAIDLNNIGIRLLQERRYRQAIESFGDAVNAMYIVAENVLSAVKEPGQKLFIVQTTGQWLRAAYAQVANQNSCNINNSGSVSSSHLNLGILTFSCGGMQASTVREFLLESPIFFLRRQNACIFRIDPHESSFGKVGGTTRVDIESSIILHNLGTAYFCLATVSVTELPGCADWYMEAAFQILKLSYLIVQTLRFQAAQNALGVQSAEDLLPLFITMMISLGKLASIRGSMHDIVVYEVVLAQWTLEFSLTECLRSQQEKSVGAAAA